MWIQDLPLGGNPVFCLDSPITHEIKKKLTYMGAKYVDPTCLNLRGFTPHYQYLHCRHEFDELTENVVPTFLWHTE